MRKMLVVGLNVLVIGIFLFSVVITLSDGQGVVVFIFTLPFMIAMSVAALVIGKDKRLRRASLGVLIAYLGILLSAPVPGLNKVTTLVFGGVGSVFEALTGKSPYQYFNQKIPNEDK